MVGSDGVVHKSDVRGKVVVRFWKGAPTEFRAELVSVLQKARVRWFYGEEYELEHKGKKIEPGQVAEALRKGTSWAEIGRDPHVQRCLLCKELLDMGAWSEDEEYEQRTLAVMLKHRRDVKEPTDISCRYTACIHHEKISDDMARALIRVGRGDKPWKDVRGIQVSNINLSVSEKDHPEGYDMKRQDIMHRHFKNLPPSAGCIFIRLGKVPDVHVWILPAYASRRANVDDTPSLEEVVETFEKRVPALKAWVLKKWEELKGLAEMDVSLEGQKGA